MADENQYQKVETYIYQYFKIMIIEKRNFTDVMGQGLQLKNSKH